MSGPTHAATVAAWESGDGFITADVTLWVLRSGAPRAVAGRIECTGP